MISNLEGLIAVGSILIPAILLTVYFIYDQNKTKKREKKS